MLSGSVEHTGASHRLLRQPGWIEVQGNKRRTARSSELALRSEEELFLLRKELLSLRMNRKVELVFGSNDRDWVNRCSSIIVEDGPNRE